MARLSPEDPRFKTESERAVWEALRDTLRPEDTLIASYRLTNTSKDHEAESPYRIKQVDEGANTVEFFVHAEDVRRTGELWKPRELSAEYEDALWRRLDTTARVMARKSPVGLVLRRTDGQTTVARKGTPVVTVTGEPSELLLFASGRQSVARVRSEGEESAVEQARQATLGIA